MSRRSPSLLLVLAGLLAVSALGCSSIPSAGAMQARDVAVASTHRAAIAVVVSGGQEFDFRISNAEFEEALRESLQEARIFSNVAELPAAELRLDVVLGDGRGVEGRELTTLWSVSRLDTQQTLWQEIVTSKGRSAHFVGVVRQRRSLEYAARENIRLGLEALSRADLGR